MKEIIDLWESNKALLREYIAKHNIGSYEQIMEMLIKIVFNHDDTVFSDKFVTINDGDYQGTLLFIFHRDTYQPCSSDYFYASVGYGSCSCCDTLQGIQCLSYKKLPTKEQINGYMTLAMHLVQSVKQLNGDE